MGSETFWYWISCCKHKDGDEWMSERLPVETRSGLKMAKNLPHRCRAAVRRRSLERKCAAPGCISRNCVWELVAAVTRDTAQQTAAPRPSQNRAIASPSARFSSNSSRTRGWPRELRKPSRKAAPQTLHRCSRRPGRSPSIPCSSRRGCRSRPCSSTTYRKVSVLFPFPAAREWPERFYRAICFPLAWRCRILLWKGEINWNEMRGIVNKTKIWKSNFISLN